METNWTNIAIDIGVLSFIGLVYYFYQKRRIIRISKEEILYALHEFRLKINEFADLSKDSSQYEQIKNFTDLFENELQAQNLEGFLLLKNKASYLDSELSDKFHQILFKIEDHLASK